MPSLPVSAHLTVSNAAPVMAPDGAAPVLPDAAAAADFSRLLAQQLSAGANVPPVGLPALEGEGSGAAERADRPAGTEAAPGLLFALPVAVPLGPTGPAGFADGGDQGASSLPPVPSGVKGGAGPVPGEGAANLAGGLPSLPLPGPSADDGALPLAESATAAVAVGAGQDSPGAAALSAGWGAHGAAAIRGEAPSAAPASAQPTGLAVHTPLGNPGWGPELGQRVVWLAQHQQHVAHINVTPPQLGPIEIHLNLNQDQASMSFVSPHAPVREAIEAALPRLREMLADSGLTLAHVDVSPHGFGHAGGQAGGAQDEGRRLTGHGPEGIAAAGSLPPARPLRGGEGLVDVFA